MTPGPSNGHVPQPCDEDRVRNRTAGLTILLVLTGLNRGGIERQVSLLAPALAKRGHRVTIAVPTAGDHYQPYLEAQGVRVVPLLSGSSASRTWARRLVLMARRAYKLALLSRREHYDIAYGFGFTCNHYALVAKLIGGARVVWGIRNTWPLPNAAAEWMERLCSYFADLAISNSEAGRQVCMARRLKPQKLCVIPNGIDVDRNRREFRWRSEVRCELGIDASEFLVGCIGRIDPAKDQRTLLRAAPAVLTAIPKTTFLIMGHGDAVCIESLKRFATGLGIAQDVVWIPSRGDAERYFNALDLLVSVSKTEGFPNVIAEAMACGVPVLCTPAGDSAAIVSDAESIVPFESPDVLAARIIAINQRLATIDHDALRNRIIERYSIERMISVTERALMDTAV